MTNNNGIRRQRRNARRTRASRLALETLEERRVLTTVVDGLVAHDLAGNGQIDEGDPGQAVVQVYDDANSNGMLDIVGTVVEPDDFADGQVLNGNVPGVTFSVLNNANEKLDLDVVAGEDESDENGSFAPTGLKTFGYDDVRFFNFNFKFRADFDTPASSAQMVFSGVRQFATDFGLLEAYDINDNLVDSYRTDGLIRNSSELMTVTSNGDISYIVAYTERLGLTGRFDSLRIDSLASERWTLTDEAGEFSLDVGGGGTYRIRQVPPAGFEQILPAGNAGRTVVVEEDATSSGTVFANTEISAPIAVDDNPRISEDNVTAFDVLLNDTGLNIDETSVQIESQPTNGTATVLADGSIEYTPNADFFGDDSLTYSVARDSGERSNTAAVAIEILPVNDPPVAGDDTAEGTGETIINVLDNDTDVDDAIDITSVEVEDQPSDGSVTISADGVITYTPNLDFIGTDTFTYTVNDDNGDTSNAATVTVTISEPGPGWQNPIDPLDVTGDGNVFAFDVLSIINELNEPQYSDPDTGILVDPPDPVPAFFDVNGDGRINPSDAILVINKLNEAPEAPEGEAPLAAKPAAIEATAVAAAIVDASSTRGQLPAKQLVAATVERTDDRQKVELIAQSVDEVFSL